MRCPVDRDVHVYLEGLADYGVVFMQLVPGTKRSTRTWDYFEELHDKKGESRIDLVDNWYKDGYGAGYLLRGGLAAIDADGPETVRRIHDFEDGGGYLHFPKVLTPSGGLHALLVHPSGMDMQRIKNHVCHPKEDGVKVPWDFKLGERTMLVAPGTVMPKGVYKPGLWLKPPTVDVRSLAPELEIYKSTPDFVRDARPKTDRIMGAMTYLTKAAPVTVRGKQSRSTLWQVAAHVVAYYDLDPSFAFYLMTVSKDRYTCWNDRCLGADGKPSPWNLDDLMDVLEQAVDLAPAHGIYLFKRENEREIARWGISGFLQVLSLLPKPTGKIWIMAEDLYQTFIEFSGVDSDSYDKKEFGCVLTDAMERLPFITRGQISAAGRIYRGLDRNTLKIAMSLHEQRCVGCVDAA